MRTGTTILCPERSVLTIMIQTAQCIHTFRITVNPPIQKVKVVTSFMHPQRAATFYQTMPTTKIIGAMRSVQIPMKINRSDFANLTGTE